MRYKSPPFWQRMLLLIILGWSPWVWGAGVDGKKPEPLIMGAGNVSGLYFPTVGAICRDLNQFSKKSATNTLHCAVEPSDGSVDNIQLLGDGAIQFGMAQSDVIANAWQGLPPFGAKHGKLRSLVSLFSETLTIMVRADSGSKEWEDLQGKTISIGKKDSETRQTAIALFKECDLAPKRLDEEKELSPDGALAALGNKEIDAFVLVSGHPNETLWNAVTTAKGRILHVPEACLERVTRKYPHYVKTSIPGGIYPGLSEEIPALGVKATLLTTTDMDEETAYQVTRVIIEKVYRFKRLDPDFVIPDPRSLFEGLVAPLHLGAFKYFQEMRVIEVKSGRPDPASQMKAVPTLEGEPTSHWKLEYKAPLHLAQLGVNTIRDDDPITGVSSIQPFAAGTTPGGTGYWIVSNTDIHGKESEELGQSVNPVPVGLENR
ncbi:MAG: TAXI family TRAP transporter solute-binding subunit [Magnetococcus sp. THC-1_WYH]